MTSTVLSHDPKIILQDSYISIEDCNHIIEQSKSSLQQSVVANQKGPGISNGRKSGCGENSTMDRESVFTCRVRLICAPIRTWVESTAVVTAVANCAATPVEKQKKTKVK